MVCALLIALALLWRPLLTMNDGLWGPADPWSNGDFVGAYWLFWSAAQSGDVTQALNHPWGESSILANFPNPFDAWLLGPIVAQMRFPLWFNLMMLAHHLLNVVGTVTLARFAGARPISCLAAGVLVAASPIMLHEHTMGHTLTAAIWPGLFGLAALLRGNGAWAALLIAIQGYAYLYNGLAFGLIALVIRPTRWLGLSLLLILPYLVSLAPALQSTTATPPPDGFTALPIDGLTWGAQQSHVRINPLVLLGLLALFQGTKNSLRIRRRLTLTAVTCLLIAAGPVWVLHRGQPPLSHSPIAFLFDIPGLSRMHHPIRMTMVAVPLLAVCLALALQRKRNLWSIALVLSAALTWKTMDNTVAWPQNPNPPGHKAAMWLADHATAVVDLGSYSMEALALQPIHQKPILSGFHPRNRPRSGLDPSVFQAVEKWATGTVIPDLPRILKRLGYSHVLVIDRGRPLDDTAVKQQLGPPVMPNIYAL